MINRTQRIGAVMSAQLKNIIKSPQLLLLFIIYPLIAYILGRTMPEEAGGQAFFIGFFATMHAVFTPIVTLVTIIAEDKEQNTLRELLIANVKPMEYLTGVGCLIFLCALLSGLAFGIIGGWEGADLMLFMLLMAFGSLCSLFLGGCIGAASKNQSGAMAVAVPVGLVFALLPMLAFFNHSIERGARYLYSQQLSVMLSDPSTADWQKLTVMGINLLIFAAIFSIVYRKSGLKA